ncbi:hypothetical protein RHGRI_014088 [Rhododendron griersonianum]|uniref:Protein FAR1-RELATED SEQUENCE n=1 Tax=Rhododendron griersonianum TaxID=479676 RepID=A0AAV6K8C3_9ERIC|nr:hypothetical protein RHGRI_014088 [Rhododendron griersonianum]
MEAQNLIPKLSMAEVSVVSVVDTTTNSSSVTVAVTSAISPPSTSSRAPDVDMKEDTNPTENDPLEGDDASTNGSHIGPVTAQEFTTENVSAQGSHIGPPVWLDLYDFTREFTTENVFSSEDVLRDWITSIGKENGFMIIIKSSERMAKNRSPRMRFACERGGKYRPFINKAKDKGGWTVSVVNGNHNHPPAKQLEGHAYPARLSSEQSTMLVDMCVSSLSSPREILSLIKGKDEFHVSSMKTIYNARYKHGFKDRAGRSQMQYLLAKLQEYGYIEFNRKDDNDCLKDLFWSHPTSGDMLRSFPRVLLMDCTYKTNRYKFPLL